VRVAPLCVHVVTRLLLRAVVSYRAAEPFGAAPENSPRSGATEINRHQQHIVRLAAFGDGRHVRSLLCGGRKCVSRFVSATTTVAATVDSAGADTAWSVS
jgi:hypothetical protein